MSCFKVRIDGVVTGATANAFSTIAALTFPNTAGYRGRLRSLTVAGAGGAVQDVQVSLRLRRTDNTTTGTSTAVNVNTIGKADPLSRASFVSAAGKNFTVEPTNYETGSLGLGAVNARNTFIKEWGPEERGAGAATRCSAWKPPPASPPP